MTNFQARQGDLFIQEIEELPEKLKKRTNRIILYGEATGHKHQLTSGDVFDGENGAIYLSLLQDTDLIHEEHDTIALKKGKYAVVRQREYLSRDMVRLVID